MYRFQVASFATLCVFLQISVASLAEVKNKTEDKFVPSEKEAEDAAPFIDFRLDRNMNDILETNTPTDTHIQECPSEPMPSPIRFVSKGLFVKVADIELQRVKEQNRYLLLQSHRDAIFGTTPPPEGVAVQDPAASLMLLNTTGQIFKRYCPVPGHYVDTVIKLFTNLHMYVNPERDSYITEDELNWISMMLDKCLGSSGLGNFLKNKPCGDQILGSSDRTAICPPAKYSSADTNYDSVVETMWRIFEVVHTACFSKFHMYYRLWHRYTLAIEDLFTQPIKQRWRTPPERQNDEDVIVRLLGPNYLAFNRNIDKCAQYYADQTPIKARLDRFIAPHTIRYSPDHHPVYREYLMLELLWDRQAKLNGTVGEGGKKSASTTEATTGNTEAAPGNQNGGTGKEDGKPEEPPST